jgi:hypothetical protein
MRRISSRSGIARKNREQRYKIRFWKDRLKGVPAFIIGCAPSVLEHDLSLLKDFFTIGINRSYNLFFPSSPTVLFWQDISFWRTEGDKIHNLDCLKVCRDIADPKRLYYNFHHKPGEYKFDSSKPHVLSGSGNSAPLCCQLAASLLGCDPIVLVGIDGKLGPNGEQIYSGSNRFWLPHSREAIIKGLLHLKKECPVEIINCGNSDLWDKKSIPEVIEMIGSEYAWGRKRYKEILLNSEK